MLMETEKSNNLSSSSWRSRKANRIIQSETQQVNDVDSSLNRKNWEPGAPRAGKARMPQVKQSGRKKVIPPSCTFSSIQAFNELDDAHPHWEGQSIESTNSNATLIQNTLTKTSSLIWSVKWTGKINYHSILLCLASFPQHYVCEIHQHHSFSFRLFIFLFHGVRNLGSF